MTTEQETHCCPVMATTHVAIVLDRSGSMESCRDATISGFNEYITGIRNAAQSGRNTRVSLSVFNHDLETILFETPVDRLRPLSRETYVPNGNTAMLDAVGHTLDRLVSEVQDGADDAFLVCIISDGYENASRRYTYSDVAERIQQLTSSGNWTFTYLGSNQDLSVISQQLNIPQGNVASYAATASGTLEAWERQAASTESLMRDIASGNRASSRFYGKES